MKPFSPKPEIWAHSAGQVTSLASEEADHLQSKTDVSEPLMERYSFSRLLRAHVLLRQVRASSIKPLKATFYSILLGCFLSLHDNSEVGHKVAKRASLFVGESDEVRMEIFRQVKKFYPLRSKFVHGQNIKQKPADFEELTPYVDEISRRIFNKIISDPKLGEIYGREDADKMFDAYFFKLLLSR